MAEDNEFSVFPRCWSSIASKNSEQLTRVVTYNVLTDLAIPEGSYNYVPENCRYMKTRHKCIMKEITQFAADIIAFQEVDSNHFDSWLKKDMEALGYFGEHSKRLDDCGMATFYKQNRFNVFKRKDCILHALAETHLQVEHPDFYVHIFLIICRCINNIFSSGIHFRNMLMIQIVIFYAEFNAALALIEYY